MIVLYNYLVHYNSYQNVRVSYNTFCTERTGELFIIPNMPINLITIKTIPWLIHLLIAARLNQVS